MSRIQINPRFNNLVEQRVIGFLIGVGTGDDSRVEAVFKRLDDNDFYAHDNRRLFTMLRALYRNGKAFDVFTMHHQIPDDLFSLFKDLTGEQYFSKNCIEYDIDCLLALKLERQKVSIYSETLNAYTQSGSLRDSNSLLDDGITLLSSIKQEQEVKDVMDFGEIYRDLEENGFDNEKIQTDLKTWPAFPASSMITIVGRSGIGKSYFSLFLMQKIIEACSGKQGIYINLEMKPGDIMKRYANLLQENGGSPYHVHLLKELLEQTPIKIISKPLMTIEDIEDRVATLASKMPISVVLIDYIGLVRIRDKTDKKYQDQEEIAQRLAALAINHKCIVLCLLQVNRDHKSRVAGQKCPDTTDAADSTGCEKSSHWWLGIDQPQKDSSDILWRNKFIIKNRKSRGEEGYFTIVMDFKNGRFLELDQSSLNLPNITVTKQKPNIYNQTVDNY